MRTRTGGRLALASLVLLPVGCGTRPAGPSPDPPPKAAPSPRPAGLAHLTVHVKDMARRLHLT
jgi:hypothetical protein